MNKQEFEAWKTCWRVNLNFYEVTKDQKQTCIVCEKEEELSGAPDTRRSNFWSVAAECSIGHSQVSAEERRGNKALGVCSGCDRQFLLGIVKGKRVCRQEGCRRLIRVKGDVVKDQCRHDKDIGPKFLGLFSQWNTYDCLLCCTEVEFIGNEPSAKEPPTPDCNHDRNICDPCHKLALEHAIKSKHSRDVVCQDPECQKPIKSAQLKRLVSKEHQEIHFRKLAQEAHEKDPRFRWCSCGDGQLSNATEKEPEWFCMSCLKQHCFICRDSIDSCKHIQLTTSTVKREPDGATKKTILRTTKRCPSCSARIEKNGGCAHMTCPACKTEFCWMCKVIFPKDGEKSRKGLHLNSCGIGVRSKIALSSLDTRGYVGGWNVDEGYDHSLDSKLWLPYEFK